VAAEAGLLRGPGSASVWLVAGDALVLLLVAPLVATFLARTQVYTPGWLSLLAPGEQGFVYPEFVHLVGFLACWIIGGLLTGAFEEGAAAPRSLAATLRRTWVAGAASSTLGIIGWTALLATGKLLEGYAALGFVTEARTLPTLLDVVVDLQVGVVCLVVWRFTSAVLLADGGRASGGGALVEAERLGGGVVSSRLLLGDVVASGIVAPALVVLSLVYTDVYTPGWVALWEAVDGGLGPAIFAHGAALTCCWLTAAALTGAFSPRAWFPGPLQDLYKAVSRRDLAGTLKLTWVAGALAAVLLLLSTGAGLYASGVRDVLATDFDTRRRVLYSLLDCFQDVIFEAICLTMWRLSFAGLL